MPDPTTGKVDKQFKIEWKETPQGNSVQVVASLTFVMDGKTWHTTLNASGPTAKDAVAVIACKKVPAFIHFEFMQAVAPKLRADAKSRTSPKAPGTPTVPAVASLMIQPGLSVLPAVDATPKPPIGTLPPTSGPAPSTPTRRTRNRLQPSETPAGTKQE